MGVPGKGGAGYLGDTPAGGGHLRLPCGWRQAGTLVPAPSWDGWGDRDLTSAAVGTPISTGTLYPDPGCDGDPDPGCNGDPTPGCGRGLGYPAG